MFFPSPPVPIYCYKRGRMRRMRTRRNVHTPQEDGTSLFGLISPRLLETDQRQILGGKQRIASHTKLERFAHTAEPPELLIHLSSGDFFFFLQFNKERTFVSAYPIEGLVTFTTIVGYFSFMTEPPFFSSGRRPTFRQPLHRFLFRFEYTRGATL